VELLFLTEAVNCAVNVYSVLDLSGAIASVLDESGLWLSTRCKCRTHSLLGRGAFVLNVAVTAVMLPSGAGRLKFRRCVEMASALAMKERVGVATTFGTQSL